MKLRNKKTGEIITLNDEGELTLLKLIKNSLPDGLSLWEEVKEPLIKDQKIRKAVRAWAEANGASRAYIVDLGILHDESSGNEIKFNGEPFVGLVTSLKTIAELCGEEEE